MLSLQSALPDNWPGRAVEVLNFPSYSLRYVGCNGIERERGTRAGTLARPYATKDLVREGVSVFISLFPLF